MLTEIEERTADLLKEKLLKPRRVSVDKAHSPGSPTALFSPDIEVITGGGKFEESDQGDEGFLCKISVFVVITFQNLRNEKERRKGVYPILLACMGWLAREDLGLEIEEIKPVNFENITEEEEAKEGKIVFQIQFETGFSLEKLTDEEIEEFLEIALDYYLRPGDDEMDAQDIIPVRN